MPSVWARYFHRPSISVVIPTFNRPRELRLCLDGLTRQTVPAEQFEVVVVDDGSTEDIASVAAEFANDLHLRLGRLEHAGPAAARNTGIEQARAPLLILWDDDQRPLPNLVEYSLEFHQLHANEADTSLLFFQPEADIAALLLTLWAFPRLYPFPESGVLDWRRFWSGAITCKKSLFRHAQFNPAYRSLEDTELGLRMARHVDLRVFFEPRLTGLMTRRLTMDQIFRRHYSAGYYSCCLMRDFPGTVGSGQTYDPETHLIHDARSLAALLSTARGMETKCASPAGPQFKLLCGLWTKAENHARADGWAAARDGLPADPPGTIGPYLGESPPA